MSTPKNTGGAAFPRPGGQNMEDAQQGMSLRDWFAGQALVGALSESGCEVAKEIADQEKIPSEAAVAKLAWRIADAMLYERVF